MGADSQAVDGLYVPDFTGYIPGYMAGYILCADSDTRLVQPTFRSLKSAFQTAIYTKTAFSLRRPKWFC